MVFRFKWFGGFGGLLRKWRNSYFIATKLSNFSPDTWSREASIAMYRNSLKELQVDYIVGTVGSRIHPYPNNETWSPVVGLVR